MAKGFNTPIIIINIYIALFFEITQSAPLLDKKQYKDCVLLCRIYIVILTYLLRLMSEIKLLGLFKTHIIINIINR